MKFSQNNLSQRLLLSSALILLITLGTTSFWLLHEVQELIVKTVDKLAQNPDYLSHFNPFDWEIVAAIFVPALVAFIASLFLSSLLINHIVAPLRKLTSELKAQNVMHLQLIECDQDIHEVQAISQAINELIEKMKMAFNRERQFTADVSHELRTPIAGIRLNLELMALENNEEIQPLIHRLDDMQRTIEQLLTMARLEQNLVMGLTGQVDLVNDVIRHGKNEWSELLASNQLTMNLSLPATAIINGDKTLLLLLIRNLLENSSRYANTSSIVELSVSQVDDGWLLSVMDEGIGVDEDKIHALTNAFQRADRRGNGIGLGLNIVARICTMHHATLSIHNRQSPKGLVIKVLFPKI